MLQEFETSGMTRREFCEQRSLSITTLDAWRRRQKRPPRLVEVAIEPEAEQSGSGFVVVLANGRRIESPWKFVESELLRLIRVAEA